MRAKNLTGQSSVNTTNKGKILTRLKIIIYTVQQEQQVVWAWISFHTYKEKTGSDKIQRGYFIDTARPWPDRYKNYFNAFLTTGATLVPNNSIDFIINL